jgi:hypothetical protein
MAASSEETDLEQRRTKLKELVKYHYEEKDERVVIESAKILGTTIVQSSFGLGCVVTANNISYSVFGKGCNFHMGSGPEISYAQCATCSKPTLQIAKRCCECDPIELVQQCDI